jgi:glycosyltransferase involved in cell wall biosynthesis
MQFGTPKISVIVSFYNKTELLKYIFAGLEKQTFTDFEVIISDDGSRESEVVLLQELMANSPLKSQHVWQEDSGFRKNIILNKSVVQSKGEYLVFIDGDCLPHPKFLEEHWNLRDKGVTVAGRRINLSANISSQISVDKINSGYLGGKITYDIVLDAMRNKNPHWENAIRIQNKLLRKVFLKVKDKGILGCNFGLYKADLLDINGFDERFVHPGCGEDSDVDIRLRNAGKKTKMYKHLITVYHIFHPILNTEGAEWHLYEEHKKNKVGYTPFGIVKEAI